MRQEASFESPESTGLGSEWRTRTGSPRNQQWFGTEMLEKKPCLPAQRETVGS